MKKEKFVVILAIAFLITSLCVNVVSAQNEYIDWFYEQIGPAIASVFSPILGHNEFDEFLFAKILLFFLLFSIIFMSLKKIDLFEDNTAVHVIVTTISSIFAVRYLKPNEIINAILLPYGGLAAAITIFLPLLIFFMFLHSSKIGSFGRRAGWFIYGAVFLALWSMRPYEEMAVANFIYLLGIGFIILSFIFDGSVHQYFKYGEFSKIKKNIREERAIELIDKIRKARNSGLDRKAEELEKRYSKLIKSIKD